MKDSIIKALYEKYSNTEEYYFDSQKMPHEYIEKITNKILEIDTELEGILNCALAEGEEIAFTLGFKCAMRLCAEIGA